MTVLLEAPDGEDLSKVSQMQARSRRIEAAVQRDRPGIGRLAQRAEIGAIRNELAP